MKTVEEQLKIIQKGVAQIVSEEELEQKIKKSIAEEKPLIIKLGLDPTAPDIHLGHTVVLRKIKQMQDLGHQAVIIIGDFTGKVGDPTGTVKGRVQLSDEVVRDNAQTYVAQICKILHAEKTSIRFNSEWLNQLTFQDALQLAQTMSVARMLEREDFKNRYHNQTSIGLHEFFYPLMQGYDSVAIKADIEMGGTDQTFNILMGRHLQKHWQLDKQVAIFMPLLEGLDGVEKMSKSLGNYIGITEPAPIMFKKVMELPDFLIIKYFELVTDVYPDTIKKIKERLDEGENPRDIKLELAGTITRLYHSELETKAAEQEFQRVFQEGKNPIDIPKIFIQEDTVLENVLKDLIRLKMIQSKSEFFRLLKQEGVKLNGLKLGEESLTNRLADGDTLKIGKKKFVRFEKVSS